MTGEQILNANVTPSNQKVSTLALLMELRQHLTGVYQRKRGQREITERLVLCVGAAVVGRANSEDRHLAACRASASGEEALARGRPPPPKKKKGQTSLQNVIPGAGLEPAHP